jgi:HEPN domain-containing protein
MNMDSQEKYSHWLRYASYDLDTADAMFSTGRWLYVAFMCQQAVEKLVKGLYVLYVSDEVPRVHNISSIVVRFADKLPEAVADERYRFFDSLTSFYMNNRYPEYKDEISMGLDEARATALITQTKEGFAWLQTMKPSTTPLNNT